MKARIFGVAAAPGRRRSGRHPDGHRRGAGRSTGTSPRSGCNPPANLPTLLTLFMDGKFLPQGAETSASGVHYRLWAPVCRHVDLVTYDANGDVRRELRMTRTEGGYFHTFDEGAAAGALYKFRLDEGPAFPDPASRWQPQGVHGPSMAIDPETYAWSDGEWQRPAFRDLVIYELHVGTFTPGGTFRGAIEKLGHVRDLGANAIEIMPVADFAGERNWGYDGVCLYAPAQVLRASGRPARPGGCGAWAGPRGDPGCGLQSLRAGRKLPRRLHRRSTWMSRQDSVGRRDPLRRSAFQAAARSGAR